MLARSNPVDKNRVQPVKNPKEAGTKARSPKVYVPQVILDGMKENMVEGIAVLIAERILGPSGFKHMRTECKDQFLTAMKCDGTLKEMVQGVLDFYLAGD
jgi:hypothetical protein